MQTGARVRTFGTPLSSPLPSPVSFTRSNGAYERGATRGQALPTHKWKPTRASALQPHICAGDARKRAGISLFVFVFVFVFVFLISYPLHSPRHAKPTHGDD